MPHRFVLKQGNDASAPVVLSIYTDDSELILEIGPPPYRTGDAVIQQMIVEWRDYVASAVEGSPSTIENVALFQEFLLATYGDTEPYQVTKYY